MVFASNKKQHPRVNIVPNRQENNFRINSLCISVLRQLFGPKPNFIHFFSLLRPFHVRKTGFPSHFGKIQYYSIFGTLGFTTKNRRCFNKQRLFQQKIFFVKAFQEKKHPGELKIANKSLSSVKRATCSIILARSLPQILQFSSLQIQFRSVHPLHPELLPLRFPRPHALLGQR